MLKLIFQHYSGRYSKPGQPTFMSFEEFFDLINALGVCNDSFGTREIGIHFNLSKQTEINELESRVHM